MLSYTLDQTGSECSPIHLTQLAPNALLYTSPNWLQMLSYTLHPTGSKCSPIHFTQLAPNALLYTSSNWLQMLSYTLDPTGSKCSPILDQHKSYLNTKCMLENLLSAKMLSA
ncbi:hypothetical protein DPMN_018926 [Dreissena polymorpha]|uniref:Uncharacterized protein n=1 Tax=Dreissena polymorpha TaxID=45954 RepID=A0A9D4S9P0_DREPO|nr:hypothetical protein DPMN_018926 [Dreissena polymorpha]